MHRALLASLLTACLLTGCEGKASGQPRNPGPQSSTGSPSPGATPEGRPVSNFVGTMGGPAIRALRQAGYKTEVVRRNACPAGVVVAQRPTGRLPRGGTVRLVVLDPATMSCAMSPAIGPAQQLVSWGKGAGDPPEFADSVDLLLGNSFVQTLDDPLDPESWEMCEAYAERSCPLSPLTAMGDRRFAVRTAPPGATFCPDRLGRLAKPLVATFWRSTTLVAKLSALDACMAVTALQVWVDDEGRIETVNLLLGSP